MLDSLLFLVVTSADYYLSMKEKQPTFYFKSSCFLPIFQFADKNEQDLEERANNIY